MLGRASAQTMRSTRQSVGESSSAIECWSGADVFCRPLSAQHRSASQVLWAPNSDRVREFENLDGFNLNFSLRFLAHLGAAVIKSAASVASPEGFGSRDPVSCWRARSLPDGLGSVKTTARRVGGGDGALPKPLGRLR